MTMESALDPRIEAQIREWKSYLLRRRTIHEVDIDELEDHLRTEISELGEVGLSNDESFLVAIKRMGAQSDLSREFARERSSRLWKQLVLAGDTVRGNSRLLYRELLITTIIASTGALAFKVPALFGINPFGDSGDTNTNADSAFYLRNAALIVIPIRDRSTRS